LFESGYAITERKVNAIPFKMFLDETREFSVEWR